MRLNRSIIEQSARNPDAIQHYHTQLIIEKMKLDKFFSIFLDRYELDDNNTDTLEWKTYRMMTKEYERVEDLIKTTKYYLGEYAL